MSYDVVIIGAGLSGLAAGIRIAHFDKKVCIVEKHTVVGGLNSFFQRKQRTFDVGLHAMTNYTAKGVRTSPLGRILKQLRFNHDDFQLCEQKMSEIRFPGKTLRFSNDFELMKHEVAEQFPKEIDGFVKLVERIDAMDSFSPDAPSFSARAVLSEYFSDPLLIEMLCCPLMYYGNAQEDDMDFAQFAIMFQSIFLEGFSKPLGGMHYILQLLVDKFRSNGGELRLGNGVQSIDTLNGAVRSVTLDGGQTLPTEKVMSSIGYVETMRLCRPPAVDVDTLPIGKVSFMETQFVLDRQPKDVGYDKSIAFFCTQPQFRYHVPKGLIDVTSGVICANNNFQYPEIPKEGGIRITSIANYDLWDQLPRAEYKAAKKACLEEVMQSIKTFYPDFRDFVIYKDSFTPKTIHKYTGHAYGAVYGSPKKVKSGLTAVKNLFICGTDQGFLGIIGATMSGISMANLHVLNG